MVYFISNMLGGEGPLASALWRGAGTLSPYRLSPLWSEVPGDSGSRQTYPPIPPYTLLDIGNSRAFQLVVGLCLHYALKCFSYPELRYLI